MGIDVAESYLGQDVDVVIAVPKRICNAKVPAFASKEGL
jgi:hypothetical protein